MARGNIERIRNNIRRRQYVMSAHAMEEMAEDNLDIADVECSILNGSVVRGMRDDPRGTKYVVAGVAIDAITPVGSVGQFANAQRYLIVTVYEITDPND